MPSFATSIVFLVLSLSTFATPHSAHNIHHHRSIAAHVPALVAREPLAPQQSTRRRRANGRRCVKKPASPNKKVAGGSSSSQAAKPTGNPDTKDKQSKPTKAAAAADPPAPHSTHSAPPPQPKSGGGGGPPGFLEGEQSGQGTYYDTGLGACGITNSNTDHIVAVSHFLFDSYPGYNGVNPNNNPVCGKKIQASRQGKTTVVTVTDRCGACQMTDLDFAPAAFDDLADPALGRVEINWKWL